MPFYTVDIMSLILIIFIVPKFMTAQCTSLNYCNHHNLDDFVIKVCIIIIISSLSSLTKVYVLVGYWPDELGPILCDLW